jgi:hypothetical protein
MWNGDSELLVALGYLVYKLLVWQEFTLGLAPLLIGLFFLSSVQLFFVRLVGGVHRVDLDPGREPSARVREGTH